MKRLSIIGLIIVIAVLINMTAFACLEDDNPVHCPNNGPGPCGTCCCSNGDGGDCDCAGAGAGAGGGAGMGGGSGLGGFGGGGSNIGHGPVEGGSRGGCPPSFFGCNKTTGAESSLSNRSSGLAKLSYTSKAPGVQTSYYGDIVPGKYFTTFKLSFFDQPSNGRFSLSPTLTYCSEFFIFSNNETGGTMFGPGWFSDFEIYLSNRIEGSEGDMQFRSATGHPHLLIKQQDGSWKGYANFGFHATMTKSGDYYYMKFDDDRTEYKFDGVEGGRILYAKDGLGNELVFTYNGSDQLSRIDSNSVLDSSDIDDRYLTFSYTSGRCTQITASDGRELHFTYDEYDPTRLTYIKYKKNSGGTLYTLYQFVYGTDEDAFYCIEDLKTNRADGTFGTLFQYTYYYPEGEDYPCFTSSYITGKKDADGNYIYQAENLTNDANGNLRVKVTKPSGAYTIHTLNFVRNPRKSEYYDSTDTLLFSKNQDTMMWGELESDYITRTYTGDSYITYTYQYEGSDYHDVRGSRIARIDYSDDTFITYTYNGDGYVTSYKDARDKITDYTYDSNGLLETVTNALDQVTNYDYDALGRLTSVAGPDHLTSTYTYNGYGQLQTVTTPGNLVTTYNYNTFGWVSSVVDPNSRAITYTYNDFGMKSTVTNWENKVTTYDYNTRGNLISVTDAKNNETEYTYNKKGYQTKTTNALDKEINFSYNSLGLLYTVTDQRSKVTTYSYDDFGRLSTETNDDGYTWTYTYYDEGCGSCGGGVNKVKTKTDGNNVTITYEYDIMGRLKKVLYPGSYYVEYTYDNNGNRLTMIDTRIDYGDETFTWEYDDLNRVTKEIYPDDEYITYAYTVGGQRDSMRIPNGSYLKYAYDTRGRLSTITQYPDNETYTWNYNSDNTIDYIDYPNQIQNHFTYDDLYRLSQVAVTPDETDYFYTVDYTYDDVGNRTKAEWDSDVDSRLQFTKSYAYDDIYQLTSEKKMNQAETSRLYEYQYTFDDAGNRNQMKFYDGSITETTNYTYNDLNQMTDRDIVDGDPFTYFYSANGSMIDEYKDYGEPSCEKTREFGWTLEERMNSMEDVGTNIVVYTYDPMGRRIMRWDTTQSIYTKYYYDGLTVIAEKKKVGAGSWSWDRVMTVAPGVIGNILMIDNSVGDDEYLHYDALGNVVMSTIYDSTPNLSYEQEAYGKVMVGYQSGYHITTKEYDSFPELYYFYQRWYDPLLGRFISTAPYPPHKEHPYNFVLNSPSTNSDPNGTIVQVCTRNAFNLGFTNHFYLHDTITGESCGMSASLGSGDPTSDHEYSSGNCINIPGSDNECTANCLMNYCQEHANLGIFFPYINDCRNAVFQAMRACGVDYPEGIPGRFTRIPEPPDDGLTLPDPW